MDTLRSVLAGLHKALGWVWTFHVDDHRPTPSQKQDHLLTLSARRIDIAMDRTCRDVEEIARTNGDVIPSAGTVFEASRPSDDVAIDVVFPVVMPTRDYAWVRARTNHQEIIPLESQVPSNARTTWGLREAIVLKSPYVGDGCLLSLHALFTRELAPIVEKAASTTLLPRIPLLRIPVNKPLGRRLAFLPDGAWY